MKPKIEASVFLSASFYALAKSAANSGHNVGDIMEQAMRSFAWPGFRTIDVIEHIVAGQLEVSIDSTTSIAKARSRAAALFRETEKDVWVSVDDDADIDAETMASLVNATHGAAPRIVLLPQLVADGSGRVNVAFEFGKPRVSRRFEGKRLAPVDFCGCSTMAVNRAAIEALAAYWPELICPGQGLFALFLEEITAIPGVGQTLLGEDVAFCMRARRAGIIPEALLDVSTTHAGHTLRSDWADAHFAVPSGE